MRVLVASKPPRIEGGHRVQAAKTAEALRHIGVDVVSTDDPQTDIDRFDIVHGFGISLQMIRRARNSGALVVLSPIYMPRMYLEGRLQPVRARIIAPRVRMALALSLKAARGRHYDAAATLLRQRTDLSLMFESADLLLPNGVQESHDIRAELGVTTPMVVVPNSADPDLFSPPKPGGSRTGVLFVGRIDPLKNQLVFLEAMRGIGCPVTLAGPDHPDHPEYCRSVRRLAQDVGAKLIESPRHADLPELYRSHKVHALPSWFETTGLVSLEAALAGCSVVSTNRGHASEYLQNLAHYCNPASTRSIREAVQAALVEAPSDALRRRVLARYTWAHTAEATVDAYKAAIAQRRSGATE